MRTPYASALACLPRGTYRRIRRAQRRASVVENAMRLMLATVALAALTLGLSSLVHSGAERVTASLNDVAAVSSSR